MSKLTLPEKLSQKLNSGIVTFSYRKSNGEIRYAAGTTCTALIPTDKQPKGNGSSFTTPTTQRYYDFVAMNWRSLKKDEILQIRATVFK